MVLFSLEKGYHYALDALRFLLHKGYNIHYTIIAGGLSEEIHYQIKYLQLEDYTSIIPGLPQTEVFKKMAEADIFLLPSVEEGIANVVLEAMVIGLPVVSSDCGGMAEVVEDGVNTCYSGTGMYTTWLINWKL
ncbi:MAG: glycosyltransferase [Lewinellaceae bacterium]|nr:glycosyltransferase [Lewinellaceae bacterium]